MSTRSGDKGNTFRDGRNLNIQRVKTDTKIPVPKEITHTMIICLGIVEKIVWAKLRRSISLDIQ